VTRGSQTGTVHVWSTPDPEQRIIGRRCTDPDDGSDIVFHPEGFHLVSPNGGYFCTNCGVATYSYVPS
jgi:hypothetical protein